MRTVVFINAHSRQAVQNVKAVKKYFDDSKSKFTLIDFIIVEKLHKLDDYIERLRAHKNVECVIVGSGDGTIVTIINSLKDRKDIVYGFLPLGTSNTFVRSLHVPLDYKKALEVFSKHHTRSVSLGMVNGTLFANIAGLGIPTRVVNNLTNRVKRRLGPLAYTFSGIRELLRHDPLLCELHVNNKVERFYTHHLLIANGKYHGHLPVGQQASVHNDKLLIVAFGTSKSRFQYMSSMIKFAFSRHEEDKNILLLPVEKARIITKPVRGIEADGELIGTTPADIRIVKNAIRVLTPKEKKTS